VNRDIFREYDIRGLVGSDLADGLVRDIGRAFATYMRERGRGRASVGRDCRLSSDRFGRLVMEGRSPYDLGALRELAAQQHLSLQVGGGYSYPLPFALVMVPFAALPFGAALVA